MSSHPNIICTYADKGNTTVILDKDFYINYVKEMLNDKNTYTVIKKDPTKKITTDLRGMLSRWKRCKYINESKYKFLYISDGTLPRAYALPKIHKANCPFRIIVSSIGSPLHLLASYLHSIMFDAFSKAESHIKNSFRLVDTLKGMHISEEYSLISLDRVTLLEWPNQLPGLNIIEDPSIDALINSMPRHCQAVIDAKSFATKY
ncbi:hypothetical protein ALC62_09745 [Cyphomyrmex costatus]|uniref:Uncharacterized protein n=1 Tax=Cyphomyrmex costatus TaxID=456900 RepID=A0A151IF60_9HYME|nr:hypothetical protein ALC62_09745 [Cyphomyrmex costatus]